MVHNKVFDGTCDMCLNGLDMICRNGETDRVPLPTVVCRNIFGYRKETVFKVPDDLNWDVVAELPVTSLTPYHALNEASVKLNEFLLVFGASGSTGMVAVQLGKKMGAKIIAVSRDNWMKTEFGVDYVYQRLRQGSRARVKKK